MDMNIEDVFEKMFGEIKKMVILMLWNSNSNYGVFDYFFMEEFFYLV